MDLPKPIFQHAARLLGVSGMVLIYCLPGLTSAWGQLMPIANDRLPGPSESGAIVSSEITKTPNPSHSVYHPNNPESTPSDLSTEVAPSQVATNRLTPQENPPSKPSSPQNPLRGIVHSFPKMDILHTAGTGLAIAAGLFVLCLWLFRRNSPSPTTPLPKEVVTVLGRAQLATRQFVQLLRVGNKLVLVSITPEGTEPITEVTDPQEVDRLLGLCMRNHNHSTTAEFQKVLNQMSHEGAKGFLGINTK